MSTKISPALYAILGAALVLAVLAAGCTTSPGGYPQTTVATTAPATTIPTTVPTTEVPTTPAATATETVVPTTTPTTLPPTATAVPTPAGVTIPVQNFGFSPQVANVPVGTTVTWTNLDTTQHQIMNAASMTIGPGLIFKSPVLNKGDSYSFTFASAGTYQVTCAIHPSMLGIINVK